MWLDSERLKMNTIIMFSTLQCCSVFQVENERRNKGNLETPVFSTVIWLSIAIISLENICGPQLVTVAEGEGRWLS